MIGVITREASAKERVDDGSALDGTARRASAVVERRGDPSSIPRGASSSSTKRARAKRRRVAVDVVSVNPPSSSTAAAPGEGGAGRGDTVRPKRAADEEAPTLDSSGDVKVELDVSCRAEPTETICMPRAG